jgi:hypothetical protein
MSVAVSRHTELIVVAVALVALVVAVYAVVTMPKPYQPPPTAAATVNLVNQISVNMSGVYTVNLGWIYISNAPAIVNISSNYSYIWFLFDGVRYGNPAMVTLQPGNHTVSAIIAVYRNGTNININYNVVG